MLLKEFKKKAKEQEKSLGAKIKNADYDIFLENLTCDFVTKSVGTFKSCKVIVEESRFVIYLSDTDKVYIKR